MKKYLSIILALVLVLSLSVPALAVDDTRQTELSFYYYAEPEPEYYVTIPDAIELEIGDNFLEITVSEAENLGNKEIKVTLEDTQSHFDGNCILELLSPNIGINYHLYDATGMPVRTPESPWIVAPGHVLAVFGEPCTQVLNIYISDKVFDDSAFVPTDYYTGYIVFGIRLV